MNKKVFCNIAYWVMIIVVILTCLFLVIYLRSNGKECIANPIDFYMRNTGKQCFCIDTIFP